MHGVICYHGDFAHMAFLEDDGVMPIVVNDAFDRPGCASRSTGRMVPVPVQKALRT